MSKRVRLLVPFLLTLGPLWLLFFARSEFAAFKIAGIIGSLALSLGLILMLAMFYNLEKRIQNLEKELERASHE